MVSNFNKIVAYGCSFTAGQELGDADILGISHDEVDRLKAEHGLGDQAYRKVYGKLAKEAEAHGKTLAWPSQLAKKVNLPCSNRAANGSNLSNVIFKIQKDMRDGSLKETDLIIVGITSPNRFFYLSEKASEINQVFNFRETWVDPKLYDALIVDYANDVNLMYQYIRDLKILDDMATQYFKGRMFLSMTVHTLDGWKNFFSGYREKLPWLDSFEFDNLLLPDYAFQNIREEYKIEPHAWSHPKLQSHIIYADKIYNELVSKGIV